MVRRSFLAVFLAAGIFSAYAQFPPDLLKGADAVKDLYAPRLLGGAFSTSQGGAPASAVNPAAGGDAQRIVFDAGYILIPTFGGESGLGHAVNLGALFPTKYAAIGGSVNFFNSPYNDFLPGINNIFIGNLNIAKEIYPGLNLGLGFNFGFGDDWAVSGDLGFRYNLGKLGKLENFTLGIVFKSLGKSTLPSAFTPLFGVSADFLHLRSADGNTADPLRLSGALDLGIPSVSNLEGKIGLSLVMAELISLSVSWGFNGYENFWGPEDARRSPTLPSIGIGVNLVLKSGGKRIIGGRLPSDGDLSLNAGLKPMYSGIAALGLGLTWNVGATDKTPPAVTIDYPETQYISPNNDGLSDYLEFPLIITDQRYVNEWAFEIYNEGGELARGYRNKEMRRETQGFKNFFVELARVKAAVEIPPSLRWDGILDSGELAPDGLYTFNITASDDNGNRVTTQSYEVIVDNTPPSVEIEEAAEADRIFSPDGDGNKDVLVIGQTGSFEDRWGAAVYNMAGQAVKTFDIGSAEPAPVTWDGTDDTGAIVTDGVYEYRISATDRAQNTGGNSLGNIIVSTVQPSVALSITDAFFSPNRDGVKDELIMNAAVPVKEGITGWQITVQNEMGATVRTIPDAGSPPPERYNYDGKDDAGAVLPEGNYHARLEIRYRNGYVSSAFSPAFTLDITPPSASVTASYTAFSPNNDGNQDEIIFTQTGSDEVLWLGEFAQAGAVSSAPPVRTVRMSGVPLPVLSWDGHSDAGALSRDGQYSYRLSSTDQAGNTGRSNAVAFTLSTADTPVFIITDFRAFSPNGDGNRDTISIIPQLQERAGAASYRVEILDAENNAVRVFDGSGAPPASIRWDGRNSGNAAAPDGVYSARIEIRYTAGNRPVAVSRPFTLDTVPPAAELSTPYTLFSPNGDGIREYVPIAVTTEGDDEWQAVITDSRGSPIRTWTWAGSAPDLRWDGTDEAGNIVPDGAYRFSLSSSDEAGNSFRRAIDNIVVDARNPRIFLTSSGTGIAPKDGADQSIRFGTSLSLNEGVESWKLELKDSSGAVLKTFPERGQAQNLPPDSIVWNGRDDSGNLREGRYTPVLTVSYLKGDVVSAQSAPVMVDVTGPVLSFRSRPEFFSPDNDGVDDELIMFLGAHDVSPIAGWSLEIREPQMDDPSRPPQLFYRIEGRGTPADQVIWDGYSFRRELVQSATDYPFVFHAADILGNESVLEGIIGVDVLVIRDGDRLKIQVPSIVFRANAADFNGLPQAQVDNNNRILRRIAQILNKFRDYRVQVEGHANPTSNPVPPAEAAGDQRLSEERARATVDFLVGFGVSRGRLSATGRGSTQPIIRFQDRDNWWKNRRVEFILIK
ncbi:MAG: gliding motility-associated C-terminal domain-containing protein [Spirochaetaceae bacterium]|jgi:flagellar hook assembly protein FlgD|nr:gliding motility-associated C-terminal domain-containing protein [Spirochaetaceae bacterium]